MQKNARKMEHIREIAQGITTIYVQCVKNGNTFSHWIFFYKVFPLFSTMYEFHKVYRHLLITLDFDIFFALDFFSIFLVQGFFVSLFYCFLNSEVRTTIRHRFSTWRDERNIRVGQSRQSRRYETFKVYP